MRSFPKISVVIPMYNASGTIRACVSSVVNQKYQNFEIIVVDDASQDDSVSIVSDLKCKLVKLDRNSGPGVARNAGAKDANCDIIVFLDADCRAPFTWLERIAEDFLEDDIAAVTGGYNESLNSQAVALFQYYDTAFRQRGISKYIKSCITANFACRKNIFNELGGFSDKRINEDMDFGLLLGQKYKILWDKHNGVAHAFNGSFTKYFSEQIRWSASAVETYLGSPSSVFHKNTWDNGEIISHLIFSSLLYFNIFCAFLNFRFLYFLPALAGLYFLFNMKFLLFVLKREKFIFSFVIFFLIICRNTAWILGICKALIYFIFKSIKGKVRSICPNYQ